MNFHGSLRFKGAALFRWAQRGKGGSVNLVFDHNGTESILEFSADAWAAIWKAAALLESGAGDKKEDRTTVSNPLQNADGKGGLTVDFLNISTSDQPIQFKVSDPQGEDLTNALPTILITTPGELDGIELTLSPKAARELRDRLDKALEVRSAFRALVKPKTIPAHA